QAIVKAGRYRELMKSALSPAAYVLEPGKRALEVLNRHGVRASQHLLRPANCHDQAGPVAVDPDACIWPAVQRMTDACANEVCVSRPSVDVAVRSRQPSKVQVQTARPAVAHLHRREVAPALMIEQGYRLGFSFLAVDLYVSHFGMHRPQCVMSGPVRSPR